MISNVRLPNRKVEVSSKLFGTPTIKSINRNRALMTIMAIKRLRLTLFLIVDDNCWLIEGGKGDEIVLWSKNLTTKRRNDALLVSVVCELLASRAILTS